MTVEQAMLWRQWLLTRPRVVQELAKRYPPGTKVALHGRVMHVISYDESGAVGVTAVDPYVDYQGAVAARETVCECCLPKLDALRVV